MNEQQRNTIEALNRLREAEMHTLLPRLDELHLSSSRIGAWQASLLGRITTQATEHRTWLVEEIESSGGVAWPVSLDIHSASLHYVSSSSILPRVTSDLQQLVDAYSQAGSHGPLTPSATELVNRITRRYQAALNDLSIASGAAADRTIRLATH